ncbi:hypothetical protein JW962_00635 [Candidatus Dojkabacteria bacterium]|nr:hypothetical protein [Candidatus Dojkabacteria bacterium]
MKKNKAAALMLLIVAISIAALIIIAVSSRVLTNMREVTELRLSETATSVASGALDRMYSLINDENACAGTCEMSLSSLYGSDLPAGCTGTVDYTPRNYIENESVAKDSVLEVDVHGLLQSSTIQITLSSDTSTNVVLVVKTIGKNPSTGVYEVLKESVIPGTTKQINYKLVGSETAAGNETVTIPGTETPTDPITNPKDPVIIRNPGTYEPTEPLWYSLETAVKGSLRGLKQTATAGFEPLYVRIRPLYGNVTVSVTGVGAQLPTQRYIYVADVSCSGINTILNRTDHANDGVATIFDFVLYNGEGELDKN